MKKDTFSCPAGGRHYGMDWLRIGAFALLIFYHTGMGFVPWDWHVKWTTISETARLPMLAMNGWRLALLFVVSGYASAALLAKNKRLPFLRSRSARLLIPTIFAGVFVIPPQVWIDLMFHHGYGKGYGAFCSEDYFRFGTLSGIVMPTWQHLWFVVYLFAYTVALVALHAALPEAIRSRIVSMAGRVLGGVAGLFLLPVCWIILRHAFLFPGHEDTHGLFDDGPAHFIFFAAFLFGILVFHSDRIWGAIRKSWRLAAIIAAVATVAMLGEVWWLTGREWSFHQEGVFTVLRAVQSWLVIIALLGIADRFWNRDARGRSVLTEAVFPFYLVHQTITVVFIWYLRPLAMPLPVAFAVTMGATALGCWLFYYVGRQIPVLRLLIGLKGWRVPSSKRAEDAALVAA